jgi:aspartyl-tRNA(Asn)/glutamyl-tRNA(Gln) amidotransferase subunit A
MSQFPFFDISSLHEGYRTKKFSCQEMTGQYLRRIAEHKELNCFIEVNEDMALQQARDVDKRISQGESAALMGIPVAVKDIIVTKNLRTTCASKILENFVPPYNATVINRILKSGAIVIGKTNMDEFGMGSSNENSYFGPVKNPWNIERVAGGSSGGSAAAVAAGLAPLALGSDTGGSIRQPASLCGVFGIKPTYGRVSRYGVIAYASSLDQIGPFASCAADAATLLSVIAGRDPLDSTSADVAVFKPSQLDEKQVRGLKIGIPKEYFAQGMEKGVETALAQAIGQFEKLGATIVDVTLPHTKAALAAYYIIAPAEASSNLARYDGIRYGYRSQDVLSLEDLYSVSRAEGFGAEVKRRIMIGTYVLSTGYYDAYYRKAQQVRTLIKRDFEQALAEKCDILLAPTSPTSAFRIGEKIDDPLTMYLSDIFTIPASLAGLSALSVPCGFSNDLPVGLQLIGSAWDELKLVNAALAYEKSCDWSLRKPTI